MNSFVTHSGFPIIQYTAVYQPQITEYRAHQALGIMGIWFLSGDSGWWLVMYIHQYSAPRFTKVYTYASIPSVAILACSSEFPYFQQWINWEGISQIIHHVEDRCGGYRCADWN
jgi:hypothetical protein